MRDLLEGGAEIHKYKSVINFFVKFAEKIESHLKSFSSIHDKLCAQLISYITTSSPTVEERDRIDKFISAIALLSASFRDFKFSKLKDKLKRSQKGLDMLLSDINGLHVAISKKNYYVTKLQSLEKTNATPTPRLERNATKRMHAESELCRIYEKVKSECHSILEARFSEIDELLHVFIDSLNKMVLPLHAAFKLVADIPKLVPQSPQQRRDFTPDYLLNDDFKF